MAWPFKNAKLIDQHDLMEVEVDDADTFWLVLGDRASNPKVRMTRPAALMLARKIQREAELTEGG